MKALSAEQMRQTDKTVIGSGICSGFQLMTAAGHAAETEIRRFVSRLAIPEKTVIHVLTGPGNNGGDGFVIAAGLAKDLSVVIHCAVPPEKLRGDALLAFHAMPDLLKDSVLYDLNEHDLDEHSVVIDCLLGTGITGAPREPIRSWIGLVNASRRPVVSVDIPSGLNADDGTAPGGAIRATMTLTLAAPKTGLLSAPAYCGTLRLVDIGIPAEYIEQFADAPAVTDLNTARALFRREEPDTYKQRRGRVLIIGGSRDYPSAPFLSAGAALRAGAGMVTAAIPASTGLVCAVPKSLIVRRIEDGGTGHFTAASLDGLNDLADNADALAVGPGLTASEDCADMLKGLLAANLNKPCVFDADALNLLAQDTKLLSRLPKGSVMTPHAGEMHRLLTALKQDAPGLAPMRKARILSDAAHACVVMKGPFSAVCEGDSAAYNLSGSPVLATAGSGDVLTGLTAAFLAKGYPAYNAARIAVFLHGLAGELAPDALGNHTPDPAYPSGVIADD